MSRIVSPEMWGDQGSRPEFWQETSVNDKREPKLSLGSAMPQALEVQAAG